MIHVERFTSIAPWAARHVLSLPVTKIDSTPGVEATVMFVIRWTEFAQRRWIVPEYPSARLMLLPSLLVEI
jgi:hypothetical protein